MYIIIMISLDIFNENRRHKQVYPWETEFLLHTTNLAHLHTNGPLDALDSPAGP
jgi:hypothetical protein